MSQRGPRSLQPGHHDIGNDVIYVQPETATVLDQQVGGIQGAVRDAGDRIGEAGGRAASDEAAAADSLVGKRTGSDVESESGSVIVPKGAWCAPRTSTAARDAGKLQALIASVTLGETQAAGAGAKDALGQAGDTAANLWDRFTTKIGEMTDATGKRADEEMTKRRLNDIADAVGRPVTKVILDREDNVVLNLGDVITHQAIQRAHDAGGLDSLLGVRVQGKRRVHKGRDAGAERRRGASDRRQVERRRARRRGARNQGGGCGARAPG